MKSFLARFGLAILAAAMLAMAFTLLLVEPSWADNGGATSFDFAPLIVAALQALSPVAVAVLGFLSQRALSYFKVRTDTASNALLHAGLERIVKAVLAGAGKRIEARGLSVDLRYEIAAEAAKVLAERSPDAIKRLGVTPARLETLALEHLDILLSPLFGSTPSTRKASPAPLFMAPAGAVPE